MNKIIVFLLLLVTCFGFSQQTEYVDFKSIKVGIGLDVDARTVLGTVRGKFKILKPVDSIFLDAIAMKFDSVTLNGEKVRYSNDSTKIWFHHNFKKNKTYNVKFYYEARPKKALYFIGWEHSEGLKQIWTQGQGKYTSNWLPSIDDMNDKIEFDLNITFDKSYEVIANGKLVDKHIGASTTTWYYDMLQPMSSYLVAFAIGKYDKQVAYSQSGVALGMYYYPEDALKFEPTYRYTKQMFDYLEKEIGVLYPWQNYKQVPVKDFLYAGMENTSVTIFSDAFVVDSVAFADRNYVNINAHELAHQWFGNLVTETSGTHHWLQEGFATYYALLAEREVFGEDYYYWRLYEYAQELLAQDKAGQGTSLLDPKASSATFYKKGAWVLHLLREQVGDRAFKGAVKKYLQKHQFKNVETDDFIKEVEKESAQDLSEFVEIWLKSSDLEYDVIMDCLKKFDVIQEYLNIACGTYTVACSEYLMSNRSDEAKSKVVLQMASHLKKEDFNTSLKVRQTIAQSLSEIPLALKEAYETLLNDASYITKEIALFNLWKNFPQERKKYLDRTQGVQGFNDKNIRTLWLTLALITEDFEPENKAKYFKELTNYTSNRYGHEIRGNAFRYLTQIQACNAICKENLKEAATHHSWQFSKLAKSLQNAD
ncbi:M1 family metallopeptidase [Mariniflexile ostreae]|uniref:Aminopeptidase N n=1 Tax=Mariniflexile ostreae TaxID=1520892 RepID=A0ABV5FGJ5_9FLAO